MIHGWKNNKPKSSLAKGVFALYFQASILCSKRHLCFQRMVESLMRITAAGLIKRYANKRIFAFNRRLGIFWYIQCRLSGN
jgi:hypothetical protein